MEYQKPNVDHERMAKEVKAYIDKNKMNLIDYSVSELELYPSPEDKENLPESSAFAEQFFKFFDYAETLVSDDDGTGFPDDKAEEYEKELAKVAELVNNDNGFWRYIRGEVLDLYRDMKTNEIRGDWENRWKAIKLFYDPVGLDVQSSKIFRNEEGEIKKREVISKRTLPPGFVIKIL